MEEHHENTENQINESREETPSAREPEADATALRPRETSGDVERTVQIGRERMPQRVTREVMRSRGIGQELRPRGENTEIIQRHKKQSVTSQAEVPRQQAQPPESLSTLEERTTIKFAAWGALFISLLALFLVGIYSARDFGPEFQSRDFEMTQKSLVGDVETLKYETQLEKIRIAVLNAHFQLFARKDHGTAETILQGTKEELNHLIASLPVEKSMEPKQILSSIENIIREIRKGPSSVDQKLTTILLNIEKMADPR